MISLLVFIGVSLAAYGIGFLTGYKMSPTAESEYEKALKDEVLYGTGIVVNGRRVPPEKVFIRGDFV